MSWEINVLDKNLNYLGFIDEYESLIWTDRYYDAGDFELYLGKDQKAFEMLDIDCFIYCKNIDDSNKNIIATTGNDKGKEVKEFNIISYRMMIIEAIEIEDTIEKGFHIKVTGRSADTLFERRITAFNTYKNFNNMGFIPYIMSLWNGEMYSPYGPFGGRLFFDYNKFNNQQPQYNTNTNWDMYHPKDDDGNYICNSSYVTNMSESISISSPENTMYDIIRYINTSFDVGFRYTITNDGIPQFQMYINCDRSTDQMLYAPVIFSDKNLNVSSMAYRINYTGYRNNAEIFTATYENNNPSQQIDGYLSADGARVTAYKDINDLHPYYMRRVTKIETPDYNSYPESTNTDQEAYDTAYANQTNQYCLWYGRYLLKENYSPFQEMEIEIDSADQTYILNKDYYLGDYVQIQNKYGLNAKAQITEVTYSVSASDGFKIISKMSIV